MGILDFLLPSTKQQQPSETSGQAKQQPAQKPAEQKTAPKVNPYWGSNPYISKESLEKKARNMPGQVEGFWNKMTAEQRVQKTREIFGQGGHLTKEAYGKKLKELEKKRQYAKTYAEKKKIEEQIKWYQALDKGK
jgi:hypothetical protein